MAQEVKKRPKKAAATAGRTRKLSKKQQRTKAKKTVRTRKPLPGSFKLTRRVFSIFKNHWKVLGGIVLVYLILNIVFASAINNINSNFDSIKTDLQASGGSGLWHAAGGFLALVASSGVSGSTTGSALQSMLFVIESLVIIWTLRHLLSGQKITVKNAYYKSTTPLIPFLLVIGVIIIQLLPVTVGALLLAAISTSVFTSTAVATVFSSIIFAMLAAWSLYMVTASIFGLYIVTLPDMQPREALRSARDLVRFRRLLVFRKVIFMPIFILLVMGLVVVPLIIFAKPVVPLAFYILSMLSILFAHTYLYSLYRGLLE
ncbi:hypothetical protein KW792_01960 [Candidatus Saccharibacteria bacterium]|nr:hypothetical protein [Candidatus Saccharibacteria bacterium]